MAVEVGESRACNILLEWLSANGHINNNMDVYLFCFHFDARHSWRSFYRSRR